MDENEAARHKARTCRSQSLARLLAVEGDSGALWEQSELGAILRHQLNTPVSLELRGPPATPGLSGGTSRAPAPAALTFGQLLHHRAPPLEVLRQVKDYAKANRDHPQSLLPSEVATLLYYASIAVALARHGVRITRLPDAALRRVFAWAAGRGWVDAPTQLLFEQALRALGGESGPG